MAKNRFVKSGTANFVRSKYSDRNMWITPRGDPEYCGQKKTETDFSI